MLRSRMDDQPENCHRNRGEAAWNAREMLTMSVHAVSLLTLQPIDTWPQPRTKTDVLQRSRFDLPIMLELAIVFETSAHKIFLLA